MTLVWLAVALAAAGLNTAYQTFQKHLTLDYDGLALSYATSTLGLLFMLPAGGYYVLTRDLPLEPRLVGVILLGGAVNIVAIYAFLSALGIEDLSVVAPLRQSTPVLVALVEPLVLAAAFDPRLVGAALAAAAGAYVLLADSPLAPVSRLGDRATLLALAAATLFAVASLAARYATVRVPPLFYAFTVYLLMAVGFAAIRAYRSGAVPVRSLAKPRLLALGALTAVRTSVAYLAFSFPDASASAVTVVLQVSIVLDVLAGGTLFGEEHVPRRLVGAGLIVAGVVLTL
jgi:drug/metabolite transporter (DMT)-like permease